MKIGKKLMLAIGLLILLTTLMSAQNPLGRLAGVVRDQSGAIIPNAQITLTNEATNEKKTGTSGNEGTFGFPQISAGSYTVRVELAGFKTAIYTEVKVDPGQEYSLNAVLEVGARTEVVEVVAGADLVNTTSAEINNTVTQRQILDLPLNGRSTLDLIRLQAGVVGIITRTNSAINGGRPSWTQMTQDGINIQDNFIRTNDLDFVPNRPTSDIVGEFTITTNTQGADAAGGASQVKFITPSGTNQVHGSLYEFNRNSVLGANNWFNNTAGVVRPYLNRNQFGGRVGGPIIKDKLFIFGYYEGFRQRTQNSQNNTIPLNSDWTSGVYRYIRPSDGTLQAVNVMSLSGIPIDPKVQSVILGRVPAPSLVNNLNVGDGRNTGGYLFNQTHATTRNYFGMKMDYEANSKNHFEFTFTRLTDVDDRPDLDAIHLKPVVFTTATTKLLVGAWRWTPTPRLQNELRIGGNLAPVAFASNEDWGGVVFTVPFITNRVATFQPQGRNTRTYQWIDNASYVKGNHTLRFGGSLQKIKVTPYNYAGRFPTVGFGFSASAPTNIQLTAARFPGGTNNISATDLSNANNLAAFLGGIITSVSQTFEVKNQSSGFVAGIPNSRDYTLNNWAFYLQDGWRVKPNLAVTLGLKWEYFSPLQEDNNLALFPPIGNLTVFQTLMQPNATIDFAHGAFYKKDLNNLGPSIGIAWDPFKNGKTSIRGGYTLAFVNEETMTVANNAAVGNTGLETTASLVNLYNTVNAGIPLPNVTFAVPRTLADQMNVSLTSAIYAIDPNIKQPYVHQISFSIERELPKDFAVEARFVGTYGRAIWTGVDYNQTNAGINQPFLTDFAKARNNGYLALAATGVFNPAYVSSVPGSQPLSVLTGSTFGGGYLTNSTVRTYIQYGSVADLANFYTGSISSAVGATSRAYFLANPGIYVADLVKNGGRTNYNAMQLEVRRRFKGGMFGQMNYTWGKALANSAGTTQARFEPLIDNARPQLEYSRAQFDVKHVMNANLVFELPFGTGKRWLGGNRIADRFVGGWQMGSILHWQSGAPISLLAPRGTFNRAARSANQGANSTLTADQIKQLFGIIKQPGGKIYYIDPKVIDPSTGRGVGGETLNFTPTFAGQVFFNPLPGSIGYLERLQFDGPAQFSWDLSAVKKTKITERVNLEFRAELFNLLNHASFYVGDYDVNSTTFGRVTSLNQDPRIVQLALKLNF